MNPFWIRLAIRFRSGPANGSNSDPTDPDPSTDPPNGPPNGPPADPRTHVCLERDAFLIRFRSVLDPFGDPFRIRLGIRSQIRFGVPPRLGPKRIPKQIPKRIQNGSKTHSPMHVKRIIRLLHNNPVLAEPDFHNHSHDVLAWLYYRQANATQNASCKGSCVAVPMLDFSRQTEHVFDTS